eukprot:12319255-Alexandrium_andersonii.AAC.1
MEPLGQAPGHVGVGVGHHSQGASVVPARRWGIRGDAGAAAGDRPVVLPEVRTVALESALQIVQG